MSLYLVRFEGQNRNKNKSWNWGEIKEGSSKMHWGRKSRRKEKGVGGTENRRGMLRWRTGRGKPQEGVRGREVKRAHERERQGRKNKKIRGRERPHRGTVEANVSCERRTNSHVWVCYTWGEGINCVSICVCLLCFIYNSVKKSNSQSGIWMSLITICVLRIHTASAIQSECKPVRISMQKCVSNALCVYACLSACLPCKNYGVLTGISNHCVRTLLTYEVFWISNKWV